MTAAGIVLAAGASTRFGAEHKLVQELNGRPVVAHGVAAALAAGLEPVIVVLGCRARQVAQALAPLACSALRLVENPDWEQGRASSLRVGLAAVPPEAPGAVVFPADLPALSPELIRAVAQALLETGKLCFPVYHGRDPSGTPSASHPGQKGHPVGFPRDWFPRLAALQGDQSALGLIQAHWAEAVKLERTDEQTQLDVDTPQALARLRQGVRR